MGEYLTIPRFNTNHNGAHAYVVKKDMLKELSNNYLPIKYASDVYLEQFYKTHNLFTTKKSIIRQVSDDQDSQNADSDTYYNLYKEGGGDIGMSFDEQGNIINKKIPQYIKHPKDIIDQYAEIVLEKLKFGDQKFTSNKGNNVNFFGIAKLLIYLKEKLKGNKFTMAELYNHTGETTFFFGSSNLFNKIYTIDPYKGSDKFNIDNKITWDDVKNGYHNNTYYFDSTYHIEKPPENVSDLDNNLSFVYINNRKNEDITYLIKLYLDKLQKGGFIGGDKQYLVNLKNKITFEDGSWIIKKENVTRI